jgi:hypothetical protein
LSSNNHIEVDYLGAVGIRFENISRKDVSSIVNNFSVFEKELDREPEIIVRFVDRLETPDLIFLGLDYAAFDKENFYLISDPVHKNKVSIPFDKIGQKLEIICEKGVKSIPL